MGFRGFINNVGDWVVDVTETVVDGVVDGARAVGNFFTGSAEKISERVTQILGVNQTSDGAVIAYDDNGEVAAISARVNGQTHIYTREGEFVIDETRNVIIEVQTGTEIAIPDEPPADQSGVSFGAVNGSSGEVESEIEKLSADFQNMDAGSTSSGGSGGSLLQRAASRLGSAASIDDAITLAAHSVPAFTLSPLITTITGIATTVIAAVSTVVIAIMALVDRADRRIDVGDNEQPNDGPADDPQPDDPPADDPPADDPPADDPPADDPQPDNPPADDPPADDPWQPPPEDKEVPEEPRPEDPPMDGPIFIPPDDPPVTGPGNYFFATKYVQRDQWEVEIVLVEGNDDEKALAWEDGFIFRADYPFSTDNDGIAEDPAGNFRFITDIETNRGLTLEEIDILQAGNGFHHGFELLVVENGTALELERSLSGGAFPENYNYGEDNRYLFGEEYGV